MNQASANWHKMIIHANEIKLKQNNNKNEALKRVEDSMALYTQNNNNNSYNNYNNNLNRPSTASSSSSLPALSSRGNLLNMEDKSYIRSQSELSLNNSPNISRVSSSADLNSITLPSIESPNKPKIKRQPSIQEMGAQFRREELERIKQEEESMSNQKSNNNSPNKKSTKQNNNSNNSPIKKSYEQMLNEFESLPPVRIDLKSRTSNSICIIWDVDFEALTALQLLIDDHGNAIKPLYQVMYRKTNCDSELIGGMLIEKKHQWKLVCEDFEGTMIVIKDLQPNTSYTFRCCRRSFNFKWGPEVNIRTGPGVPSNPIEIQPNEITSTSVLLTWLSPEKDNGLPILGYILRMKPLGGTFNEIYRGKNKVWIVNNLLPNSLYIFEVIATNRVGDSPPSNRLAIRTLREGAQTMTPWVELIDSDTNKIYYLHPKTKSTTWILPTGALLDRKISFQNKLQYFYSKLKLLSQESKRNLPIEKHSLKLYLSRDNILEETLRQLRLPISDEFLSGPIRIHFDGEEGIDGGGLSREWAVEVAKKVIQDTSGLMIHSGENSDDNAIIDIRSTAIHGTDCRWLFLSLGKFFAKVIIDELAIGIKFNDLFLTWICGKLPTLTDLKLIDPIMYRGLEWVLNNPIEETDLTFSASYDVLGTTTIIDFIPNGRNIPVTEQNKVQYVDLMMAWLIQGRYEPSLTHFLDGFHSILPIHLLENFHVHELQYLLSGQIEIDIQQLMSSTCYTGLIFPSNSNNNNSPNREIRGRMINTQVSNSSIKTDMLPVSHTCFNQIVLPNYKSESILKDKLLYAIRNTGQGFHLK